MRTRSVPTRLAEAALAGLLLGSLTACGADGDTTSGAGDSTATGADSQMSASEPLTVENVVDRCDELTPIITTLRGAPPEAVEPSSVMNANSNGFKHQTAHCTFAYEGDDFSDPNRVDIYIDSAPDNLDGLQKHWDAIAASQELTSIDGADDATWYAMTGVDAKSSARALIGDTLISVRVAVPKSMENEVFMSKTALAEALQAVVDLH